MDRLFSYIWKFRPAPLRLVYSGRSISILRNFWDGDNFGFLRLCDVNVDITTCQIMAFRTIGGSLLALSPDPVQRQAALNIWARRRPFGWVSSRFGVDISPFVSWRQYVAAPFGKDLARVFRNVILTLPVYILYQAGSLQKEYAIGAHRCDGYRPASAVR